MFSAANYFILYNNWKPNRISTTTNTGHYKISIERDHSKLDFLFAFYTRISLHDEEKKKIQTINIIRCNDIISVRSIFPHCIRWFGFWSFLTAFLFSSVICVYVSTYEIYHFSIDRPIYHARIYLSFSHHIGDSPISFSLEFLATKKRNNTMNRFLAILSTHILEPAALSSFLPTFV